MNIYQQMECMQPSGTFLSMLWYRRAVLAISCLGILWSIIIIFKKRQYVFMTLKLLMFVQLFYFVAMFSVLLHDDYLTGNCQQLEVNDDDKKLAVLVNSIIIQKMSSSQRLLCGLQGFINLSAYNISYFFGVLLTLNVRKVLDNTHKNFMRQNLALMISTIALIFVIYAIPLVLIFVDDVPYSYGPQGFYLFDSWFDTSGSNDYMIYYCGLCVRDAEGLLGSTLMNLQMFLPPFLMFSLHGYLLIINYRSTRFLKELKDINPRQWFIIRTGFISFILFMVQFINFFKLLLASVLFKNNAVEIIIIVVNCLFDLMPLVIVLTYYSKYYKQANTYSDRPAINKEDQQTIVTTQRDSNTQALINAQNSTNLRQN